MRVNAERNKRCFFLVLVFAIAANLLFGLSVGIRLFAVIALLFTTSKVLWDWKKRGWKYVGAARFDYVLKSLTSVIAIILLTWFYLLHRHPILWLAVPLVAIYIPVAITKYGHPLSPVLTLASAICRWIPSRYTAA
jgi:FlaA1/EpsC-like NDP-sugar epimerase